MKIAWERMRRNASVSLWLAGRGAKLVGCRQRVLANPAMDINVLN